MKTSPILTMIHSLVLVIITALLSTTAQASESIRVAAAADLRFAMEEIVANYRETQPGHDIEVVYGSSGRFHAQIANGAPFDLYFSADISYPQRLADQGLAASAVMPYGTGRLVLWSNSVDATELRLEDLTQPAFRHIAIANPRHAPYGQRAREVLESTGLWEELQPRLVYGENIAHAMQMVESGAAQVGIIALALALNPHIAEQGKYQLIDDQLHRPLEQGFIVTRRAGDKAAAWQFADFIQTDSSRRVLMRWGFVTPAP